MRFTLVALAAAAVNAVEVSLLAKRPRDEGMMPRRGRREFTNERGELDLGSLLDTEDMPDEKSYPGEDEAREVANDQVLNWKNGDRVPKVIEVGQHERLTHNEWYK